MRRITVTLPDELSQQLDSHCSQFHVSASDVVRESLVRHLSTYKPPLPTPQQMMSNIVKSDIEWVGMTPETKAALAKVGEIMSANQDSIRVASEQLIETLKKLSKVHHGNN